MRSDERLIESLASVNAAAINNHGVGDHVAGLCHEAAERMKGLVAMAGRPKQPDNGIVDYA